MKKLLFVALLVISIAFNVIMGRIIHIQHDTLLDQDTCLMLMKERLDTCFNRNERIFDQLYEFQDIRIKQLRGELPK